MYDASRASAASAEHIVQSIDHQKSVIVHAHCHSYRDPSVQIQYTGNIQIPLIRSDDGGITYHLSVRGVNAEISVDLRDNKTEYVDLGLPSGTLWAVDYEKEGNDIFYLPYDKASQFDIPTEEQCNELLSLCRWESIGINSYSGKFDCVGPNGKIITFKSTGFYKVDSKEYRQNIYFWLKDQSENPDKAIAFMRYYNFLF